MSHQFNVGDTFNNGQDIIHKAHNQYTNYNFPHRLNHHIQISKNDRHINDIILGEKLCR